MEDSEKEEGRSGIQVLQASLSQMGGAGKNGRAAVQGAIRSRVLPATLSDPVPTPQPLALGPPA